MADSKSMDKWGAKAAPMAVLLGVALALFSVSAVSKGRPLQNGMELKGLETPELDRLMARQRMEKRQLLKASLGLTETKEADFWPLYYVYQGELMDLYDQKLALIARFDADYPAIPAPELNVLVSRYLKLKARQIRLLDDYFHRISRRFDPVVAARFVQIESAWNGSFDLKLIERLPLAPGGASSVRP